MAKEIDEEKKHKLYLELKELDEEIKKLNSHLEHVDEQVSELNTSKAVVTKFMELKKGDEIRVPISSGIYIKAELSDVKNLMVNVGSNVTVEKSPDKVLMILDTQIMELTKYRQDIVKQMKAMIARIEEIQKEFE